MKKLFLYLFFLVAVFVFNALVFSDFEGGPARLQALGGQQIALADESNVLDLYGAGFASAVFARPAVSFVALYPELDLMYSSNVDNSGNKDTETLFGGGTGADFQSNDGVQLFLSQSSVLVIKPMYSIIGGEETYTPGSDKDNYINSLPGGEVSFAQKFGSNLSASITGGFLRQDYFDTPSTDNKFQHYIDKIEYELSVTLLPAQTDGWTFSCSAGNITSMIFSVLPSIDFGVNENEITYQLAPFWLFNSHSYEKYDYTLTTEEDYKDLIVSGERINLGAALGGSKDLQFDIKAGAIVGMGIVEKSRTVTTTKSTGNKVTVNDPDQTEFSNGNGFDCNAGLRSVIGGVTFGIKADETLINGNITGGNEDINIADVSAGPVFGGKGFLIPVELFYEEYSSVSKSSPDENFGMMYDMGIRAGNEIALSGTMSLRYGVDFMAAAEYDQRKTNGIVVDESGPAGSGGNPWLMQIGYNAGMGFTGKTYECNVGISVAPQWSSPKDSSLTSDTVINAKIYSDLRIFL
jgi:hypothetical protein